MFDSLSEQYRWCIYCKADCWPEPEHQKHNPDCPMTTGVYPVTDDDYNMEMCCSMCSERFEQGSSNIVIDIVTGEVSPHALISTVICIGCAAAISVLGVKYEG